MPKAAKMVFFLVVSDGFDVYILVHVELFCALFLTLFDNFLCTLVWLFAMHAFV